MNKLVFFILRLIDDKAFHSGEKLAKQIGCSRSSISNALRDIEQYGLDIQKICGRGYRWSNPFVWLDQSAILNSLNESTQYFNLALLDSVVSTNNYLLNSPSFNLHTSSRIPVIVTELQLNGRGRRGRQWHSGLGDSLTFSLKWRFEQGASFLSGLSLVIGVAIVRVLRSFSIQGVGLKWPNDVLYCSRKLAGVLIELQGEMFGPSVTVIGIGLNIRLSPIIRHTIEYGVSDIFDIIGKDFDRNILLAALLSELRTVLIDFGQFGFAYFRSEWVYYHAYDGEDILLTLPDGSVKEGIVEGVNDDGALLLRTSMGVSHFNVGEVTLRAK